VLTNAEKTISLHIVNLRGKSLWPGEPTLPMKDDKKWG